MDATKKSNKRLMSQIAADILSKSKGSEENSLDISRLRHEIIKDIGSKDEIFGKFREILDTLRDTIPEEEKLYHATIKTLSATFGTSQKDVLEAADSQLAELRKLDEAFASALADRRAGLKAMKSKSTEIRDQVSRLREKIGQLEEEEREILDGVAARSREIELAEIGVKGLLADVAAEITGTKAKLEEFIAERQFPPLERSGDYVKDDRTSKGESEAAREGIFQGTFASQDTEDSKKCSVCGCRAFWYAKEKIWKCYVCAYEER